MKKEIINKKNITSIVLLFIAAIVIILCFVIHLNNKSISKIGNVSVYKKVNYSSFDKEKINLTLDQENKIKNYISKESLKENKVLLDCEILGIYTIAFDDYEIAFDGADHFTTYLYNKKDDKYMQINISSKLKNYVINIVEEGEK